MLKTFDLMGKYRFRNYLTLTGGRTMLLWDSGWISNLITDVGRNYLLHGIKGDNANNISHIILGTETTLPKQGDTILGVPMTNTVYLPATSVVSGTPNWTITYTATFTAAQINGTNSIGLTTGGTSAALLITRSVHEDTIGIPTGSTMTVDYVLGLRSASKVVGWKTVPSYNKTFKVTVAAGTPQIKGVDEITAGGAQPVTTGYLNLRATATIAGVQAQACSFWHDTSNNILYVHASDDTNPDTTGHVILVTFGG